MIYCRSVVETSENFRFRIVMMCCACFSQVPLLNTLSVAQSAKQLQYYTPWMSPGKRLTVAANIDYSCPDIVWDCLGWCLFEYFCPPPQCHKAPSVKTITKCFRGIFVNLFIPHDFFFFFWPCFFPPRKFLFPCCVFPLKNPDSILFPINRKNVISFFFSIYF